jgi:hypothetical protein
MLHSEYTIRTERLWEDYFLDPLQWWDDRLKKVRVLACLVKKTMGIVKKDFDFEV